MARESAHIQYQLLGWKIFQVGNIILCNIPALLLTMILYSSVISLPLGDFLWAIPANEFGQLPLSSDRVINEGLHKEREGFTLWNLLCVVQ